MAKLESADLRFLTGRLDAYPVGDLLAQGSVATVYRSGDVVLKVARRPASNRFLENERVACRTLAELTADRDWLRPYFPRLRDVGATPHRRPGPAGQRAHRTDRRRTRSRCAS